MRIIRKPELAKILSVSEQTLWRMEKQGELPARIKISKRTVGWRESEIEEWLNNRPTVEGNS